MLQVADLHALLTQLIAAMDLKMESTIDQDGDLFLVNLTGRDTRLFEQTKDNRIGALVTVLKLIAKQKFGVDPKIVIDINNQRKQRLENVAKMARKKAEMVRVKGEEEEMPPMTPAERRAVHMELKDMTGIKTESRGVEPHRRIVIVLDDGSDE